MRVLINTLSAAGNRAGVGQHTAQLAAWLPRLEPEAISLYPSGISGVVLRTWIEQWLAYQARAAQPGWAACADACLRRVALSLARRAGQVISPDPFRAAIRHGAFALYHEPNYIPLECDLPTVATVHDLSVLLHPHWHPPVRVAHFEKHFEGGLKRCRHLFAVSEFCRREIVKHLGWPEDRVSVTPNGVREGLRRVEGEELTKSLAALGLSEGYLLHVGTLEPRKNVLMLLEVYCSLPSAVRESHPLVLVGAKGWNSCDVHRYLNEVARHKGVRWLGYVEDRHFAGLYSAARALVFPTFYEGFGIPTIEMMACGGAVIASTAGAVAETVGGKAHLLDPHDADGWREAILRVCSDDDWWQSLRQGVEAVARPFTWRRCAQLTLDAYRIIGGSLTRAA